MSAYMLAGWIFGKMAGSMDGCWAVNGVRLHLMAEKTGWSHM